MDKDDLWMESQCFTFLSYSPFRDKVELNKRPKGSMPLSVGGMTPFSLEVDDSEKKKSLS